MSDSPDHKRNISFTGAKLDWINAANYDRRLTPMAFKVAVAVANHVNATTGKAFPSQELIAERVGTVARVVRRSLKTLAATGWLRVQRTRRYDAKTKRWKTHNTYSMLHGNVLAMFDLQKAAAVKPDRGVLSKQDSGVPLTPSVKHPQSKKESTKEGTDSKEGKRVLPLVSVIQGGLAPSAAPQAKPTDEQKIEEARRQRHANQDRYK
jgi:DNA-binding FadR family transcriptional regulator